MTIGCYVLQLACAHPLMIFGALFALTAAWRYHTVKNAILNSLPTAAEGTTIAVAIIVACIAAALIPYILASA